MKWWEWVVIACTALNVLVLLGIFWVFSDVLKVIAGIKGPKPEPAKPIEPPKEVVLPTGRTIPVMPRWMDPASEKGLEFLAYEEILREPNKFTEAERVEAETYFERLQAD